MKLLPNLLITSLLTFLSFETGAQQATTPASANSTQATAAPATQPPQRDAQGISLLAQAYALMGGTQKSRISDAEIQGTLSKPEAPNQSAGTFVAKTRGFDLSLETAVDNNTTSYKVFRSIGTSVINGVKRPLPWHATAGLTLDLIPILARWTEFVDAKDSVRYLGQNEINGRVCHLIEVESPSDSDNRKRNELGKADVFIDQASGLIYAIRYKSSPFQLSSLQTIIETRYSDYQNVEGVVVPMTVEKLSDGQPVRIMRVSSVKFNNGLGDIEFKN